MGKKSELSSFEHGCIGALVGSIEQSIMRPTVYWKAMLQQDTFELKRAINPKYFYRGLPVAVASIAPITAVQFAARDICDKTLKRIRGESIHAPTTELDENIQGVFAGVVSSMVQSPFQLVEINQQRLGGNMVATLQRIIDRYGVQGMNRGLSMTMVREGIFTWGVFSLDPWVKRTLLKHRPETSELSASGISAIVSGTVAAVLSHPADTLKTRVQGTVFDENRPRGPYEALLRLRDSEPGSLIRKCYKGLSPRVFRLICCTYIYRGLTDLFEGRAHAMHAGTFWSQYGR